MRPPFLFEFCDQTWIPAGARECLFEAMDACNSGARSFNRRVADKVLAFAAKDRFTTIVEVGAGRAPITTLLAADERAKDLTLAPCDLVPNETVYRQLEQDHAGQVVPFYQPVDVTTPPADLNSAVLVMTGMLHHVPFEQRPAVLCGLSRTNSRIAVFEPLKRSVWSILLTLFAVFPALLLPITCFHRPGKLRRLLWCWLVPIVPPMFVWDGVTSCLRQWTSREWRRQLEDLGDAASDVQMEASFHSLTVSWLGNAIAPSDNSSETQDQRAAGDAPCKELSKDRVSLAG